MAEKLWAEADGMGLWHVRCSNPPPFDGTGAQQIKATAASYCTEVHAKLFAAVPAMAEALEKIASGNIGHGAPARMLAREALRLARGEP